MQQSFFHDMNRKWLIFLIKCKVIVLNFEMDFVFINTFSVYFSFLIFAICSSILRGILFVQLFTIL